MKNLLVFFILLVLLASCSGGMYSHYPKASPVKKQTLVVKKNTNYPRIHQPATIDIKKPTLFVNDPSTIITKKLPQKPLQEVRKKLFPKTILNIDADSTVKKSIVDEPVDNTSAKSNALLSLVFSILGWVGILLVILVPPSLALVLLLGGIVLEIIALVLGIAAISKVKKAPNSDDINALAVAGIVISSAYLLLMTIIFVFIALLFASL